MRLRWAVLLLSSSLGWDGRTRAEEIPLPALVMIPPGTRVDRSPPAGWTHLIVKSTPRLSSGELSSLPSTATDLAVLFKTVVLAEVRLEAVKGTKAYALRRVGIGICTTAQGTDVVVTPSKLGPAGAVLGTLGKKVLEEMSAELSKANLAAKTHTFALYDAPAVMCEGGSHRATYLRYAILADYRAGSLQTLVWERAKPRSLVLMKPNLTYVCDLDVSVKNSIASRPVEWSFAVKSLPPGEPSKLTSEIQPWLIRDTRDQREASRMEKALRSALPPP